MEKSFKIYRGSTTVTYHETDEIKQRVFDELIEWCEHHNIHSGESFQNDDPQIEAPWFIADLVDKVLKFKTVSVDEDLF